MAVQISKIVFNPFSVNTYLVWDDTKQCVIIDPGCYISKEKDQLVKFCSEHGLKPKYIINTHCHIDHVLGNSFVKEYYNIKLAVPEEDIFLLDMMLKQASLFGLDAARSPEPDTLIKEELVLELPFEIKYLFTPGHTPGEYSIYIPEGKFCITGDVLFREGIGRVDLWGGDYDTLLNSITTKLLTLPDDTVIYPGHGDKSSIGYEKMHNSYLR